VLEFGEIAKNNPISSSQVAPLTRFARQGCQPIVRAFNSTDFQPVDPSKENGVPNNALC
jgi:hypothetical protein